MEGENQVSQTNEPQTKKSFWRMVSPKTTFVFGLVAGVAIFASLSLLYSYLALGRIGVDQNLVADNQEEMMPELTEPSGVPVGTFLDTGQVYPISIMTYL